MDILYPRLRAKQIGRMLGAAIVGALVGGAYGALHDQVSYSISPEYFTRMKFLQFAYADFGWSNRWFAAVVGIFASWWVGMIAGWFLGRIGFGYIDENKAVACVGKALGILIGTAALTGAIGIALGYLQTAGDGVNDWNEWREELYLKDVRSFAVVAYLHGASYIGAIIGLIAGSGYLVWCARKERA